MRVDHANLKEIVKVFEAVIGLELEERDPRRLYHEGERDQLVDVGRFREAFGVIIAEINLDSMASTEKFV